MTGFKGFMVALAFVLIPGTSHSDSARATHPLPDVRVDHVVMSLSPERFERLSDFLLERFGEPTWFLREDAGKGSLGMNTQRQYVEIWDFGGPGIGGPVGNSIAIGSSDEERGKQLAIDYYGYAGVDYSEVRTTSTLFTVGSDFEGGYLRGGTFYVAYGPGERRWPPNRIRSLDRVVLGIPAHRIDEANAYRAFGFEERSRSEELIFTDTYGVDVHLIPVPNVRMLDFGYRALEFTLEEPVEEREEHILSASEPGMEAILEGSRFRLILRPDLIDTDDESALESER